MTTLAPETAILLCGHGSRDPDASREFASLAGALRAHFPDNPIHSGILEFSRPTIGETLQMLYESGVRDVIAIPIMVLAAGHAKNDIPSVLNDFAARYPAMRLRYGRDLGITPNMLAAAAERISDTINAADRAAAQRGSTAITPEQTLLAVVGRGTSDPDANGNMCKITRMLWEGLGLGWGETCYSGLTFPLVAPALDHYSRLGYRRIVVMPYFLFTGVLVKRVHTYVARAAALYPDIDFVVSHYLDTHPEVVAEFAARINEVHGGAPAAMNCSLCKYRDRIIGFEVEQGSPQKSHHHHVEGGAHHHDHSESGHHHHGGHTPYPHADHPLGPQTLIDGL